MKFPKSLKHIILFLVLILMNITVKADSICSHNNFRFIEIIGQAGELLLGGCAKGIATV